MALVTRFRLELLAAIAAAFFGLAWLPTAAAQADAQSLFSEGNRAFREGAYRTALRNYRGAEAAGMDSALLHYNMGVAHYKLKHYKDAERELLEAAQNPKLAPLAFYNLGLTNRAGGNQPDAERYFQLAWERTDNRKLKKLSAQALASLSKAEPVEVVLPFEEDRRVGDFQLTAITSIGFDDNVYRTPRAPYQDLAQTGQPLVTPVQQSGTYAPIAIKALYVMPNEETRTDFFFAYRLNGQLYLDSEQDNANEFSHKGSFGADTLLGETETRQRTMHSEFYVRRHVENNFDPDNGFDRELNGEDLSDHFTYTAAGLEAQYRHQLDWLRYGIEIRTELRDYDEVPLVDEYDQNIYLLGGYVLFPVAKRLSLTLDYDYYIRENLFYRARDLNGQLLTTNEPLEFQYHALQASIGYQLGRRSLLGFDIQRTLREDMYIGYADYIRDRYRVRASFRPTRRFRTSMFVSYRIYDYPNAFAFNDPAGGPREVDVLEAAIVLEFSITKRIALWSEFRHNDVAATDARVDYVRNRGALGMRWRL